MHKHTQERKPSPRFSRGKWFESSPKQKHVSSVSNSDKGISKPIPTIANEKNLTEKSCILLAIDLFQQINNSSCKISSHLKHFFSDRLNCKDIKIEYKPSCLAISCTLDSKYIFLLTEKLAEYGAIISIFNYPMKICIDIDYKELHKFFGIMGDEYNFQNREEFLKFLQPKSLFLYMGFFNNRENIIDADNIQSTLGKEVDSHDYDSEEIQL